MFVYCMPWLLTRLLFQKIPLMKGPKKNCCNVCQTYVKSSEKGFKMCEACKDWYHVKCVGMNVKLYDLLLTEGTKQIHWFCNQCDSKVMELCNITARCEKMERDLSEIRQELNKKADMNVVANSLMELENKITKQLQTKLSAEVDNRVETHAESFRDIMTQQLQEAVDDRIGVSSDELQEMQRKINDAKMSAMEEQDKEACRNNIVVYHVPESDGGSFEERKIDDKRFVAQLFTKMEVGVMNEDIRDVIRLGKWALSGNA